MTLGHLPANDPAVSQYQLWIVDPARDEIPVDGGVFDVPAAGGPVVIPIHAKLRVTKPAAFVITLEKPGGVVRSKQEIVVAIAKS
jgi:anti-sigma-K factor RskA